MKFPKSFFTLTGAAILLLSSLASIANAQGFQTVSGTGIQQATVPCAQNPSFACTLFAAFNQNISPDWYDDPNQNPQSNGLGKDPVFMYVNGVLVNGTQSLTNSSIPTQGLWVGLANVNTTVSYLGGAGDNSTSFGTCTAAFSGMGSGTVSLPFGTNGGYYAYKFPYSCHH